MTNKIMLGQSTYPDWPSLMHVVLEHVQQAAHESNPFRSSSIRRRVLLKLSPDLGNLHSRTEHKKVIQVLGERLESECGEISLKVSRGDDSQHHHLILEGF